MAWISSILTKGYFTTQQNSYSISHLLGTVTTEWRGSDSLVTTVELPAA